MFYPRSTHKQKGARSLRLKNVSKVIVVSKHIGFENHPYSNGDLGNGVIIKSRIVQFLDRIQNAYFGQIVVVEGSHIGLYISCPN